MTTLTIKTTRPAAVVIAEKVLYGTIPGTADQRDAACDLLIDGDGWTIAEYIKWLNRDSQGFALMGADSWAEQGITTASGLGKLLDAEHERNMEKERRYG